MKKVFVSCCALCTNVYADSTASMTYSDYKIIGYSALGVGFIVIGRIVFELTRK